MSGVATGLIEVDNAGLSLRCPDGAEAERTALRVDGADISFRELDIAARRVAAGLVADGIEAGERVAMVLRNGRELFELVLGCAYAGVVAVPLNWRLSRDELLAVLGDAGPSLVVADTAVEAAADIAAEAAPTVRCLRVGGEFDAWRDAAEPARLRRPAVDGVVLQVYTSGTSGAAKGVQLTAGNIGAKIAHVGKAWGLTSAAVSLLATPLFHIGALSWALVGLHAGASTLVAPSAQAEELATTIRDEQVSHVFLVPTLLQRLCAALGPDERLPSLRHVVYGAAPITPAEQRRAAERLACRLHQLYGLTETTGGITQLDVGPDSVATPEAVSVGVPYPWVELEIRDPETGAAVGPGEHGEIWTRSAQNTIGYAGRPEETAALLSDDGWLRTGDGGRIAPSGHVFLTDRIKDMIVTGGENVYPAEVERVLREHADVLDVAVVGMPDDQWGEIVAAVVVPRRATAGSPDELIAFTAGRIAGYKRPRLVLFTETLPRNATGKVLKRALRSDLAASQEEVER